MNKRIVLTIVVEIDKDADVNDFIQELDYNITHPNIVVIDTKLVDISETYSGDLK
jgi:hypothetical protein